MKKTLLTLSAFAFTMALNAQIIFNVLQPQALNGNYEMTHASDWGLTPDLAIPSNAVTGTLAFVSDGSAADSLGCLALTNAADIQGKIAVVYRGECQFGVKALNANVAGAIAVVIINNVPGSPVGMAAGDVGDQVTVPVVMISSEAGALLRNQIIAGNVEAFIGNKLGLFAHDLGFFAEDIYLPNGNSIPRLVAQNGSEFNYTPAAWVHNYGQKATSAARYGVTIVHNGSTVYSHNVSNISLASGGNVYVSTPTFAPANYTPGLYVVTMSVSFDEQFATLGYVTGLASLFDGGEGYTTMSNVATTTTGSGTGLTVDIVADNGQVLAVTINEPGSGYEVGDMIMIAGGTVDATIEVVAVADEEEQYEGDNVYTINVMISDDNIFTRASVNPDGTMIGGPAYRVNTGEAFSACVAYTHPQAGRMALEGMHFAATAAAGFSLEGEVLGLTVWKMSSVFTDVNDPNYGVEVSLVANADFDFPSGAENGQFFFSTVKTGDEDFLILEDNARYVFCVGTDNENVFIVFDGGGLDNRRQLEGANGNAQPDYYIYTTGLGRFEDFYGLPAIGLKFFDKNLIGMDENTLVDVTPFPNPTTEFLNIPLKNLNGAAKLNVFDATGRLMMSNNVDVQNNLLTVDVQNLASGMYTFSMSFENGKSSTFKVMVNK